jgi:DnaJ family protein A protein 2
MSGINGGPGHGGMDAADVFASFFQGAGGPGMFGFDFGPGGPGRGKSRDDIIPYEVSLEDLYNGKSVKMNMEKNAVCGVCTG